MVNRYIGVMAVDEEWGVGKNNDLPWNTNKEDLRSFKEITQNCIIVMGRKTWVSIGSKKLPNRINVVISSQHIEGPDLVLGGDLRDIFKKIHQKYPERGDSEICVIGGAGLIKEMHDLDMLAMIYLTTIEGTYGADTFFDKTIIEDMNCYWTETLRTDYPKTVLRIYAKGNDKKMRTTNYGM